jgi:signal transduction histidine kinase
LISIIKKTAASYAWLLLAAAWLYTLSFIVTNYFSGASTEGKAAKVLEEYIHSQESVFEKLTKDTSSLHSLVKDTASPVKKLILNDGMGIFVYQVNDLGHPVLVYWNTHVLAVEPQDVQPTKDEKLVHYLNGYFVLIQYPFTYQNLQWVVCGLVPVQWDYFLTNEYLKSEFALDANLSENFNLTMGKMGWPVEGLSGKSLFGITRNPSARTDTPGGFSVLLRLLAVLLFLIFLERIANKLASELGLSRGLIFWVFSLLLFRLLTYYSYFPFKTGQMELFDPVIYASSSINRSLGDLLINSLLAFWIVAFIRKHLLNQEQKRISVGKKWLILGGIALWLVLPLFTFYLAHIISSLVLDSTIVLDTSNFFALNIYTFISFIVICLCCYTWFYCSAFIVLVSRNILSSIFWRIILLSAISLLYVTIGWCLPDTSLSLIIIGWLLIYVSIMENGTNPIKSILLHSPSFIFWALFLMLSVAGLMAHQNTNEEKEMRKKIAEKLNEQTDPAALTLLNMSLYNFSGEKIQKNFHRFFSATENKKLKDSLINYNFSGYLNKYDTRIYTFDQNNRPLFNEDSIDYDLIRSVIINTGKQTGIDHLYYYENAADRFGYIYEVEIFQTDSSYQGNLFVFMHPRAYQNNALQPELFKQTRYATSELSNEYAYVIYNNGRLADHFNNYKFSDIIDKSAIPKKLYDFRKSNGNSELWYSPGNSKLIIIVRKNNILTGFFTLFTYLFVIFLLTAFIIHIFNLLLLHGISSNNLAAAFRFNIRTQVQATIAGIIILSFIIVGTATITFFILRFNRSNKQELITSGNIAVNEVQSLFNTLVLNDRALEPGYISIENPIERMITQLAERQQMSLNMYSLSGMLIATSQPLLFNRQILSNMMHPKAFYRLKYDKSIEVVQSEKVGKFEFLSLYKPIRNENGDPVAYINIPSLHSQNDLKLEISNFLVTLITLNAIIFILAGAIGLILTNRITSSFEFIGSKMKEISLGKTNEAIIWNKEDEIGALIDEYNKMVIKLEESAVALAKSEREDAWREMARQVAHEIKNPLTPMKLSIQYLQKAIDNNAPNTKELSQKVATTLVEQIDQLSKIASDFSQFANLGNNRPEKFNLTDSLNNLIMLYQADSRLDINYHTHTKDIFIFADKTQINRLFTNLIKNGIEASESEKIPLSISVYIAEDNLETIVCVKDYGSGIPVDLQLKIFQPNFTTKSAGTGLGLAICKAIVEKAGGRIWFETEQNRGTTFFVALNTLHTA